MVGSRVTLIDPDGAPIMVMGEALTTRRSTTPS
jgi:hypothetical protein